MYPRGVSVEKGSPPIARGAHSYRFLYSYRRPPVASTALPNVFTPLSAAASLLIADAITSDDYPPRLASHVSPSSSIRATRIVGGAPASSVRPPTPAARGPCGVVSGDEFAINVSNRFIIKIRNLKHVPCVLNTCAISPQRSSLQHRRLFFESSGVCRLCTVEICTRAQQAAVCFPLCYRCFAVLFGTYVAARQKGVWCTRYNFYVPPTIKAMCVLFIPSLAVMAPVMQRRNSVSTSSIYLFVFELLHSQFTLPAGLSVCNSCILALCRQTRAHPIQRRSSTALA